METKDFQLRIKALSEEGAFTGLAAVYDAVDLVGDSIQPGAFAKAIGDQGRGFPLLWAHRQDEPIGLGTVEDSKAGLVVHGQLLMDDPAAARAHAHLKAGTVRGLSIGFSTPAGGVEYRDGIRYLKAIRLHEISVVAVPAAPRAQVTSVKSLMDVQTILRTIRAGAGLEDGMLEQLRAIDGELKQILATHERPSDATGVIAELRAFADELKQLTA